MIAWIILGGFPGGRERAASLRWPALRDKRAKARYRGTVSNEPAREVPS